MNLEEIEELLSRHADRLLAGRPAAWTEDERADAAREPAAGPVAELLRLAERVRTALIPVEPRAGFAGELKQDLAWAARLLAPRRDHRRMWLAGLGGAAFLAGIGVVSYLGARAGMGWMQAARSRAALSEAQPAPQ